MARTKKKGAETQKNADKIKAKKTKSTKNPAKAASKVALDQDKADAPARIIIEACKSCQSFKKRAMQVETILTTKKPDVTVSINPDKPRKGCFEIRDTQSGELYISLLDMPRPFTKMKAVDMDELAQEILGKLEKS